MLLHQNPFLEAAIISTFVIRHRPDSENPRNQETRLSLLRQLSIDTKITAPLVNLLANPLWILVSVSKLATYLLVAYSSLIAPTWPLFV